MAVTTGLVCRARRPPGSGPGDAEAPRERPAGGAGDWNILIEGETGVGSDGRLVAVNCAAMTDSLLGSQLFGNVRGAFGAPLCITRG